MERPISHCSRKDRPSLPGHLRLKELRHVVRESLLPITWNYIYIEGRLQFLRNQLDSEDNTPHLIRKEEVSPTYNFLDSNFKGFIACKKINSLIRTILIHDSELNQLLVFFFLSCKNSGSVLENQQTGVQLQKRCTILTGDCWIEIKYVLWRIKAPLIYLVPGLFV